MYIKRLIALFVKSFYSSDYFLLKSRVEAEILNISEPDKFQCELTKMIISGEDHRFYYHPGFDVVAIVRAIKKRLLNGKKEGASTIEQQLVRVLINDYSPTFSRKVKEICLATTLSEIAPKRKLPFVYLNIAYYGTNMNGLNQALAKLSCQNPNMSMIDSCAELVARIKYPEPRSNLGKRKMQIALRKSHLLKLYAKHSRNRIFKLHGKS